MDDSPVPIGRLPSRGLYVPSEADVTFRFGSTTPRRRRLALRLRRWIELARRVGARRLMVDGSFVTGKREPHDVDAVVLLPDDFQRLVATGAEPALELEQMLLTRRPEEIFAAEDEADWDEWVRVLQPHARGRRPAQGAGGGRPVIANVSEYQKAEEELRVLEERLARLQQSNPVGSKGFTKAGIRKMIARLHEELAVFEGSEEARQPELR